MLVIRESQLSTLGSVQVREFETQLVRHFARFYPRECRLAGNDQVQQLVAMGLSRARQHGYVVQREASLYVNLMIILGQDFDRDPQIPWAAQQIDDTSIPGPFRRIRKVHQSAVRFLEQTVGDDNQHIARALLRVRSFRLSDSPDRSADGFDGQLATLLARLYPQKFAVQREPAMRGLITHAIESARTYGIVGGQGITLFAGLMFMLGSGFTSDPMYPWAGRVLGDERLRDEASRVEALHGEAIAYLVASLKPS